MKKNLMIMGAVAILVVVLVVIVRVVGGRGKGTSARVEGREI